MCQMIAVQNLVVNEAYLIPGESIIGASGKGALVMGSTASSTGATVSNFAIRRPGNLSIILTSRRFFASLPGGVY